MRAISLLDRAGVLGLASRLVSLPYLPIFTHRRATREELDKHVALVARSFHVVGIEELRANLLEARPLPRNPAILSFDAGYREHEDVALPVLQRHGVKGVFFISTDNVNDRKPFWWDRVNALVDRSEKKRIEIEYPEWKAYDLAAGRANVIRDMIHTIETTHALDVETFLQTLAAELDVPWSPDDEKKLADESLLTWDGVRAIRRAGMDVQSGTRTQRILQTLTAKDLESELVGSKRRLEKELGESICAIAYPSGFSIANDRAIVQAVRDAGYELGFSTAKDIAKLGSDPFDIRRLEIGQTAIFAGVSQFKA